MADQQRPSAAAASEDEAPTRHDAELCARRSSRTVTTLVIPSSGPWPTERRRLRGGHRPGLRRVAGDSGATADGPGHRDHAGHPERWPLPIARDVGRDRSRARRHAARGPASDGAGLWPARTCDDAADRGPSPPFRGRVAAGWSGPAARTGELSRRRAARRPVVQLLFGGPTSRAPAGRQLQTFRAPQDQLDRLLAAAPRVARAGRRSRRSARQPDGDVGRPTGGAGRTPTFDGLDIAAGTTVQLFAQCAGTDPRAFRDGGFDVTAKRKPHFGFGAGVHHCIGPTCPAGHGRGAAAAGPADAGTTRRRRGRPGCPIPATPARSACRWRSPGRRAAAPPARAATVRSRRSQAVLPLICVGAAFSAAAVTSAMPGSPTSSASAVTSERR